jgi:Fungal protein kinase
LTGVIQSDISVGNLMMNEEDDNPSWPSFLIDLDLAIKEKRENLSGAPSKTGTRAFMAIGALYGEKHNFMHDLESFFWVLFWICIHYAGPNGESRVVKRFDKWNYADTEELAEIKKGVVVHEKDFIKMVTENFTRYYQPLIPWVNRLRKVVFPNGERWEKEDRMLYSQIKEVLQKAMQDFNVLAEWIG